MKKRKFFLITMLLTMLLLLVAVPAYGAMLSYRVPGGNIYFDTDTGIIVRADKSITTANIPATIEGVAVTSLGEGAFADCIGLTDIVVPDGVTTIGNKAFFACDSLTNVKLPDSVTSMGYGVFACCRRLTDVTLPSGITTIREGTFDGCSALTNVKLPDSLTSIGYGAFTDCRGLTDITIPDGVTTIGGYAFAGCTYLTDIVVPDGVTTIGDEVFFACSSLTNVKLPDSLTSMGYSVFSGCWSLTDITIPSGITTIDWNTFAGCFALTDITLPDSLISIESCAFMSCQSLTNITLPDSLTSIGYWAFLDCRSLTDITIPDGVTTIAEETFSVCSGLINVKLPASLTVVCDGAFEGCSALVSAIYPGTEETFRARVFVGEGNEELWEHLRFVYPDPQSDPGSDFPGRIGDPLAEVVDKGVKTAEKDPTPTPAFPDVQPGSWYEPGIRFVAEKGLMQGTDGGLFDPNGALTRAMVVTVLYRLENTPAVSESGNSQFYDVAAGQYYTAAVVWGEENGIVLGYGDDSFRPDNLITREELAAVLYRYADYKGYNVSAKSDLGDFSDREAVSYWAMDAMGWAVKSNLLLGDDGALRPAATATRAELATMLMRFFRAVIA